MKRALLFTCIALTGVAVVASCKSETTPSVTASDAGVADAFPPDEDAEAEAGVVGCPFPATDCPGHCREVGGYELDEDAGCMREAIFGCTKEPGSTTDAPCFKRIADGKLVIGSSSDLGSRPEFAECTSEERTRIAVSPCE